MSPDAVATPEAHPAKQWTFLAIGAITALVQAALFAWLWDRAGCELGGAMRWKASFFFITLVPTLVSYFSFFKVDDERFATLMTWDARGYYLSLFALAIPIACKQVPDFKLLLVTGLLSIVVARSGLQWWCMNTHHQEMRRGFGGVPLVVLGQVFCLLWVVLPQGVPADALGWEPTSAILAHELLGFILYWLLPAFFGAFGIVFLISELAAKDDTSHQMLLYACALSCPLLLVHLPWAGPVGWWVGGLALLSVLPDKRSDTLILKAVTVLIFIIAWFEPFFLFAVFASVAGKFGSKWNADRLSLFSAIGTLVGIPLASFLSRTRLDASHTGYGVPDIDNFLVMLTVDQHGGLLWLAPMLLLGGLGAIMSLTLPQMFVQSGEKRTATWMMLSAALGIGIGQFLLATGGVSIPANPGIWVLPIVPFCLLGLPVALSKLGDKVGTLLVGALVLYQLLLSGTLVLMLHGISEKALAPASLGGILQRVTRVHAPGFRLLLPDKLEGIPGLTVVSVIWLLLFMVLAAGVMYLLTRNDAAPLTWDGWKDELDMHAALVVAVAVIVAGSSMLLGKRVVNPDFGMRHPGQPLKLPAVAEFDPPVRLAELYVYSNLANSLALRDGEAVAELVLTDASGRTEKATLQAGIHTAEWAYDRPDVTKIIAHSKPPVAYIEGISNDEHRFAVPIYWGVVELPAGMALSRLEVAPLEGVSLKIVGIKGVGESRLALQGALDAIAAQAPQHGSLFHAGK